MEARQVCRDDGFEQAVDRRLAALVATRADGRGTEVEREVAIDMVLGARDPERAAGEAWAAWRAEREPDLRMAWATIVLGAQKRLGTFDRRPCL